MKHFKFFVFLCILTFTVSCGQQKKYIEYKVKEGESMRTIASNLDMKTKDLLRLNPDVGRKPDANTVIIVPNKKNIAVKDAIVVDDDKNEEVVTDIKENEVTEAKKVALEELKKEFVVYEVKKGDTFYSLTRFYNITKDEMLVLNPELIAGLKVGQHIKIRPIVIGVERENNIYEDLIDENVSLKVAMLMPFKATKYDQVSGKDIFRTNNSLANIVSDFYLGSEIAIDSLRKQGINIELNVFDTESKNSKVRTILTTTNLKDNDVIIGPLYSEEVEMVAKGVNIPVVFPVYSDKQAKFYSKNVIKTSPSKSVFRKELITYIKENFNKGNVVIVGDGSTASNFNSNYIKRSLEMHDSIFVATILKPIKGYIAKDRFISIFKPNVKNWVIMATNNNVIIADAINSLISLPKETEVKVFTFDKNKAFDKVDNLKLAKIGFTFVSDRYVDETSLSTKNFNKQYFKKNNALPSFYATEGFDITYDVLIRLASGKDLNDTFNEGASFRIENKFDYNTQNRVTENNGLFIVQYNNDLSLSRLK